MSKQHTRWGDEIAVYVTPGARLCGFCSKQFYRKSVNERDMIYNVHMSGEVQYASD